MTFKPSERSLAIALFAALFLTACGGGGDDSSNNASVGKSSAPNVSDTVDSDLMVSDPIVSDSDTQVPDADDQENDSTVDTPSAIPDNDIQAALVASNKISLARSNCGLTGLTDDPALGNIAIKHANYIKYVYANSIPTRFNAHTENKIDDISNVTGSNNPFFGGTSFEKRLINASYASTSYPVTENIAQTQYYHSAGNIVAPEVAALSMTKSLLAAPYHLRSLMLPSSSLTSSAMVAYKPYGKDPTKYQGYVIVNHAAATPASKNNTIEGVFTYPCQGVSDTVTALYNESPDPFRGTRDLRTNPIGQPVYINMPSAKSIKVSNIKFHDVKRNIDVPVKLLDADDDPYKGTNYELPANEAFIMPLTDSLKSCEVTRYTNQSQQCGLYSNSEYRVSFDVLIDNKDMQSKSFTFKTGKVTY